MSFIMRGLEQNSWQKKRRSYFVEATRHIVAMEDATTKIHLCRPLHSAAA